MKYTIILILNIVSTFAVAQQSLQPVGEWREHLPYQSAIDVTAGNNKIYAATPYSLFSVDQNENSVERLSKITGLSETGVSAIQYDKVKRSCFHCGDLNYSIAEW